MTDDRMTDDRTSEPQSLRDQNHERPEDGGRRTEDGTSEPQSRRTSEIGDSEKNTDE